MPPPLGPRFGALAVARSSLARTPLQLCTPVPAPPPRAVTRPGVAELRRCGGAGRAAGAGTPGGGGAARARGAGRRAGAGWHGVALHQPPLLPGAALEPAGPLGRGGAADPAQLLGPRERGAGPGRRCLAHGRAPRRRPGPRPGRAAHSVPAGLLRVARAREAQRCDAGAQAEGRRPEGRPSRTPWRGDLRAPPR